MYRVDGGFVFLKQKTAYEMRISDWSSDVCSSDLRDAAILVVHRLLAAGEVDDRKAAVTQPDAAVDEKAATVRPAVREAVGHRLEQVPVDRPIGRASCRARVCPYV